MSLNRTMFLPGGLAVLALLCSLTGCFGEPLLEDLHRDSRAVPPGGSDLRLGFQREQFEGVRKIIYGDLSLEEEVDFTKNTSKDQLIAEALMLLNEGKTSAAISFLIENDSRRTPDSQYDYWLLLGYAYKSMGNDHLARQSIGELFTLEDMEYDEQARIEIGAWRLLRDLWATLPRVDQKNRVLGVVVNENIVGAETLVAGYADGNSRLVTERGIAVIGGKEFFPAEAIELAKKLVEVSASLSEEFLQGDKSLDYRIRPSIGGASITFLTPSGIHTIMAENVRLLEADTHPLHGLWEVKGRLYDVLLSFAYEQ